MQRTVIRWTLISITVCLAIYSLTTWVLVERFSILTVILSIVTAIVTVRLRHLPKKIGSLPEQQFALKQLRLRLQRLVLTHALEEKEYGYKIQHWTSASIRLWMKDAPQESIQAVIKSAQFVMAAHQAIQELLSATRPPKNEDLAKIQKLLAYGNALLDFAQREQKLGACARPIKTKQAHCLKGAQYIVY